jgi:hypothetical protein
MENIFSLLTFVRPRKGLPHLNPIAVQKFKKCEAAVAAIQIHILKIIELN